MPRASSLCAATLERVERPGPGAARRLRIVSFPPAVIGSAAGTSSSLSAPAACPDASVLPSAAAALLLGLLFVPVPHTISVRPTVLTLVGSAAD